MAKIFKFLTAALMLVIPTIGFAASSSAAPVGPTVVGDFTFTADDANVSGGALITAYTGTATNLVIPATATISGQVYQVTGVIQWVFANKSLTSVTFPSSFTRIDNNAFQGNALTSLVLPGGVFLGNNAFHDNQIASLTFKGVAAPQLNEGALSNNPLTSVFFKGQAPACAGFVSSAFGNASISFYDRYAAPGVAGGFSDVAWCDYSAHQVASAQVTFDLNGKGDSVLSEVFTAGDSILALASPLAEGFDFSGWFDAASAGSAIDFAAPVNADTTVYAQWAEKVAAPPITDLANTGGKSSSSLLALLGLMALCTGVLVLKVAKR